MPTIASLTTEVEELRSAVAALTERLDNVRVIKHRSNVPVGAACALGKDPAACPDASVYHYQHGCKGESCLDQNAAYYAENRDAKAGKGQTHGTSASTNKRSRTGVAKAAPVAVPAPKRAAAKTAPAKPATAKKAPTRSKRPAK